MMWLRIPHAMTDLETQLHTIATEALSERERHVMREEVKHFMLKHPARMPLAARAYAAMRAWRPIGAFSFARLHPMALSLVLVLTVGTSTTYAAEGALPGDTLYPVKIHVNESVQGALAVSDEAKVLWHATRVERRLAEAEALAAKGRLTPVARVELEIGLDAGTRGFDAAVLAMADATNSPAVIAAAASDFSEALERRERALARVARLASSSEEAVAPIIAQVRTRSERIRRVREVAERFASAEIEGPARPVREGVAPVHATLPEHVEKTARPAFSAQATTSEIAPSASLPIRLERDDREARRAFRDALRDAQETNNNAHAHEE